MENQNSVFYHVKNNVGVIEFDQPDSKVNLLSSAALKQLEVFLEEIRSNSMLKAVVFVSKKQDVFIAGADIKEIEGIKVPQDGELKSRAGQQILDKIEDLRIPAIAVIDGVALGGGCELALACHYRVATFNEKIKMGLPEVNLGIIPGFGGTYRLPKLVGLTQGLKMILTGKLISSREAFKVGLVDRIFPQKNLDILLDQFVDEVSAKGYHRKPRKEKTIQEFLLERTSLGRGIIFDQARKTVLKTTKGFYPAPLKAIEVIKSTYGLNRVTALSREAKAFSELVATDVSKNLIQLFYLTEKYRKLIVPGTESIAPLQIKKCAVLGAGIMGGGIAQLLSSRKIWVRLKDVHYDAIAKGLKAASLIYQKAVKARKIKEFESSVGMARITSTLDYSGFQDADMVIEAVVENIDVKKNIFKELSAAVSSKAILCTNTSALSVTEMAKEAKDPSRVIGLHFFNPVERMPLIEIIKTDLTSPETIASALQCTKRLGKTPIIVKDSCGFLVNRILLGYVNESGRILEEGNRVEYVDRVMTDFGMPMGPFALSDEVGLDVGFKVLQILEKGLGERFKPVGIFEKVYQKKTFGKKTGKGFYIHGKKRIPNPEIYGMITKSALPDPQRSEYLKRMVYTMINEAARCLQEGIVDNAETVDVGMIMGTGFPAFRGGLLRYTDFVGPENIVNDLLRLKEKFNAERFLPCDYLNNLSRANKKFYQDPAYNE
ncbi:MAG: 3-hydroxyacyl-CoA dehydrogenase NAD-binding domain-containing protein [Candidatus Omnitrophota bacterium]